MLKEKILNVINNINSSIEECQVQKQSVLLVPATKMVDIKTLEQAKENGLVVFGENKVQELLEKYDKIQGVEWHLIGHLQTNKVKYIIDKVKLIQSVDSLKLAKVINDEAKKRDLIMPVLIQVNIAREFSKGGVDPSLIEETMLECSNLENIKLCGLMAMMPIVENNEENAVFYKNMYELFEFFKNKGYADFKYLSMGMSGDYQTAIKYGANLVRVGSGIFGNRIYSK